MAEALNLFPNRAAIGRVDARGDVYMSPEFSRALAILLVRVGGPTGGSTDDLAAELATSATATGLNVAQDVEALGHQLAQALQTSAYLGELRKQAADLEHQIAQALPLVAQLGELRKQLDALDLASITVPTPSDWEHPGKIGARKASTGAFTTLAASGAITSTVATGTPPLVVASTDKVANLNADLLDGKDWAAPAAIGSVVPAAGTFTAIDVISAAEYGVTHLGGLPSGGKFYGGFLAGHAATPLQAGGFGYTYDATTPANSFFHLTPYGSVEGSVFKLDTLGNFLVLGKFGCNAKTPQAAFALGAAATDLATVLVLANNLRTMAVNNGTGA